MSEGVIAVDPDLRMIIVNKAAREILGMKEDSVEGHTVYEVLRNPHMQSFVERLLATRSPAEDELEWDAGEKRLLVLRGSIMMDSESPSGAVVVIRDITRMRKLEDMRRDFVANVSHEIKTPVTAIKTAVETLAAQSDSFPPPLRRFLEIIGRHADRLADLVGDVLSLSALESGSSSMGMLFSFRQESLFRILQTALELCRSRAESAQVTLKLECGEKIRLFADASLLEQAVVNLVDNAINGPHRRRREGGSYPHPRQRSRLRNPRTGARPHLRTLLPG